MNKDILWDVFGGILAVTIVIGFATYLDSSKVRYTYMLEEDSINYPVDYCSIRSGIVTYEQDDIKVQKLCAHCVCTRRLKNE